MNAAHGATPTPAGVRFFAASEGEADVKRF
jgi:hypothetical protein